VKSVRSATAAAMANILLFAMVNHISPASGKSFESAPAGLGIREGYGADEQSGEQRADE
jgi:hypothetical protein